MNTIKMGLAVSLILLVHPSHAQSLPRLSISNATPQFVTVGWSNQVGTSYRLLSTKSLSSGWTPLADAFSQDTNLLVTVPRTSASNDFFRVMVPTNSGVPTVLIFSPTNGQTVTGIATVGIGAQIGSEIMGINLFLDGALIGYIDSGAMQFDLDTSHYSSGTHTLYASAVDTENNVTSSGTITLNFQNQVRWLDANTLFSSFVPISVQSDIFPATWTVTVKDASNAVVRTFSASTTDGNIETNWDGTDSLGMDVPPQAGYSITVTVSSGSLTSVDGGITPWAGSGSGSTGTAVWREGSWRSGETILARVNLGTPWTAIVQGDLVNLRTAINAAAVDLSGDRVVFQMPSSFCRTLLISLL